MMLVWPRYGETRFSTILNRILFNVLISSYARFLVVVVVEKILVEFGRHENV